MDLFWPIKLPFKILSNQLYLLRQRERERVRERDVERERDGQTETEMETDSAKSNHLKLIRGRAGYTDPWSSLVDGGEGSYLPNYQTTLVIALDALSLLFFYFHKLNSLPLGQIRAFPSFYYRAPWSILQMWMLRQHLDCMHLVGSATRCGIISPLWQHHLKAFGNYLRVYLVIGNFLNLRWQNFFFQTRFIAANGRVSTILSYPSGHTAAR